MIHRADVSGPADVDAVQAAYRNLNRPTYSADELVNFKFQMQQWRTQSAERLLDAEPTLNSIAALQGLSFAPPPERLLQLAEKVVGLSIPALTERAAEYFATLAAHEPLERIGKSSDPRWSRLAGPRVKLPIIANAPAFLWPTKRWSKNPEFSRYEFEGTGVRYRGLVLQPGDVLASTVNLDGNGMYTALSVPRGIAYHLGAVAIVEFEGRPTPVVLETYKLGVRMVPLSTFLSREFNSFVDIYRLKSPKPGFRERINSAALNLVEKTKGYNFDTEDPDRDFLACTMVPSHLFELAGEEKIASKSAYPTHPTAVRNLVIFELVLPAFLAATDYVMDPRLECVGAVDNAHFVRNVAREICELAFVEVFKSGVVQPRRLPWLYHLNCFGIRQMKAGNFFGTLIGMPYGFTAENFCKGPTPTMAIIEIYEQLMVQIVRKCEPAVRAAIGSPLDLKKVAADPGVKQATAKAFAFIASAYR